MDGASRTYLRALTLADFYTHDLKTGSAHSDFVKFQKGGAHLVKFVLELNKKVELCNQGGSIAQPKSLLSKFSVS